MPIAVTRKDEIDHAEGLIGASYVWDFDHTVSTRVGYRYSWSLTEPAAGTEPYREHRLVAEVNERPKWGIASGLTNRTRFELRWIDAVPSWRLRERILAGRKVEASEHQILLTPYGTLRVVRQPLQDYQSSADEHRRGDQVQLALHAGHVLRAPARQPKRRGTDTVVRDDVRTSRTERRLGKRRPWSPTFYACAYDYRRRRALEVAFERPRASIGVQRLAGPVERVAVISEKVQRVGVPSGRVPIWTSPGRRGARSGVRGGRPRDSST